MTIFKKSLLTLGLTVFIFSLILFVSFIVFMNFFYYKLEADNLKNTANTLITAFGAKQLREVFSSDAGNFEGIPVSEDGKYRLTLIDTAGNVLWDSHVKDRLVNHIDREEIKAALDGKEGSAKRNSISTRMKLLYYALPVFDGNVIIGVFRLSASVQGFGVLFSSIVYPFILFAVIMACFAFFAIYRYSHYLSSSFGRLVAITQKSRSMLSGFQSSEPITQEFKSLEKALRAMTEELNLRFELAKLEGSRFEAILNGMSEALFAMDSSLKLHLINPKAREIFNLGNKDVTNISLLEATRSSELTEIAMKAISEGTTIEKELNLFSGKQYFQIYASPLSGTGNKDQSQKTPGVVLVLQDITRLVKLERIRKDFVANVSHELRTPIQLVKGFSENLLDTGIEKENEKQIIHFMEIIRKNAGIMEDLTNDLLALACLENNESKTNEMKEYSAVSLIEEAVSSVEFQAAKKQIKIIIDCSSGLKANLNGSLIIQGLINLIDNGIKYSPDDSKLLVCAYLSSETNELIFEVRDKGTGIRTEHLDKIFERFYRADRSKGGTGLGLSIVRHIALLHNGKAEVESHAGEGSIFRIRVPNVQ